MRNKHKRHGGAVYKEMLKIRALELNHNLWETHQLLCHSSTVRCGGTGCLNSMSHYTCHLTSLPCICRCHVVRLKYSFLKQKTAQQYNQGFTQPFNTTYMFQSEHYSQAAGHIYEIWTDWNRYIFSLKWKTDLIRQLWTWAGSKFWMVGPAIANKIRTRNNMLSRRCWSKIGLSFHTATGYNKGG